MSELGRSRLSPSRFWIAGVKVPLSLIHRLSLVLISGNGGNQLGPDS